MAIAARAAPDGYTLLLTSTAIAVNPALYNESALRSDQGFRADLRTGQRAERAVRARRVRHQDASPIWSRAPRPRPARFNYSSPGAGTKSHLTGEQLKLRAGIDMVHIPYRGGGPATMAVLEGTVHVGSVALAAGRAA